MNTFRHDFTRRDFLKRSAVIAIGASGIVFPSVLRGSKVTRDQLKVALVGSGGRGTGAISQLLESDPNTTLVAIADVFQEQIARSLSSLSAKYGGRIDCPPNRQFVGFDAYQKAIEVADVIVFAAPPAFRPRHFEAVVQAGKHSFMEKPLGVDVPGLRAILRANESARTKGLSCVVGYQRRFQASYREMIKRIQQGEIGTIERLEATWGMGNLWARIRENGQTELQYQVRNWLNFVWLSGESCLNQHVHNLDVCNWIMGKTPVKAAGNGGREDAAKVVEKFGDCCDHFFVDYTYPAGVTLRSSCYQFSRLKPKIEEAVFGSKGTASSYRGPSIIDKQNQVVWSQLSSTDGGNPYQKEQEELLQSIRNGIPLNNIKESVDTSLTAILGRTAAYTGREVTWEEVINSREVFCPPNLTWDSSPPTSPTKYGDYPVPAKGKLE